MSTPATPRCKIRGTITSPFTWYRAYRVAAPVVSYLLTHSIFATFATAAADLVFKQEAGPWHLNKYEIYRLIAIEKRRVCTAASRITEVNSYLACSGTIRFAWIITPQGRKPEVAHIFTLQGEVSDRSINYAPRNSLLQGGAFRSWQNATKLNNATVVEEIPSSVYRVELKQLKYRPFSSIFFYEPSISYLEVSLKKNVISIMSIHL